MKKAKIEIIHKIKSSLFDILNDEDSTLHFEQIPERISIIIAMTLIAQEVIFYYRSEWGEQLISEGINLEDSPLVKPISSVDRNVTLGDGEAVVTSQNEYYIKSNLENFGYFWVKDPQIKLDSSGMIEEIGHVCANFISVLQNLSKIAAKEKKYRLLFGVTEKFHSTMDMDAVLAEIIDVLHEVYPGFHYSLFLSQDTQSNSQLPIKCLQYDSENMAAMEAYVTGTVQMENYASGNCSILYAPLKGKQGVYGVLQITAVNVLVFPIKEVEFISLLANTAGTAIENAQLYQQSNRLIADLKLINEVSHELNSKQRFSEIVSYVCKQIISSFNAEEVGFILFHDRQIKILDGSTPFFFTAEAEKYIQDFHEKLLKDKSPMFIGDFKQFDESTYRSIMAIPMIQTGGMVGFILVFHSAPYHFSFDSYKLLQSLIHHSTLAFVNSTLREELEKMVVTDYLTKLYTRSYLDRQIQKSMIDEGQGTFILIDIDNFKKVNDTYGHQIGDEILIQVANVMRSSIRDSDIAARWGGEELSIYLPRVPMEKGRDIASRLIQRVKEGTNPSVTVSCGVSHWSKDQEDSAKQLFNRADEALYYAKSTGKNRVITQTEMIQ